MVMFQRVTLSVQLLDIKVSDDCEKDFVAIYDGPNTQYQLLAKICGRGVSV